MLPSKRVTPESPIEDQIRYLDDFLREGGSGPYPDTDADTDLDTDSPRDDAPTRQKALQRIRELLTQAHRRVATRSDF